jgi:hypothetical protein
MCGFEVSRGVSQGIGGAKVASNSALSEGDCVPYGSFQQFSRVRVKAAQEPIDVNGE